MPTLSFHTSDDSLSRAIEERVDLGGSRSAAIESALGYYFLLLADARRSLRAALTDGELSLICDALNGTLIEVHSVKYLRMEIADACSLDGLDTKWGVDAAALEAKCAGFSLTELVALHDAVRRFWKRSSDGEAGLPADMGVLG